MFKKRMRNGLFARLQAKGVNEVIAYELAYIVYPGDDHETMAKPPIVDAKTAAAIVSDFVDSGSITESQMLDRIWSSERQGTGS